jgi:hypothetical protein
MNPRIISKVASWDCMPDVNVFEASPHWEASVISQRMLGPVPFVRLLQNRTRDSVGL